MLAAREQHLADLLSRLGRLTHALDMELLPELKQDLHQELVAGLLVHVETWAGMVRC